MKQRERIERGVELLMLCQHLQSEKDGVDRPEPGVIDKSKTLDEFAIDIGRAISDMSSLNKLLPMFADLMVLGRLLEKQGKINVDFADDYAQLALNYVLAQNGLAKQ